MSESDHSPAFKILSGVFVRTWLVCVRWCVFAGVCSLVCVRWCVFSGMFAGVFAGVLALRVISVYNKA
jgi:hypothetical protein